MSVILFQLHPWYDRRNYIIHSFQFSIKFMALYYLILSFVRSILFRGRIPFVLLHLWMFWTTLMPLRYNSFSCALTCSYGRYLPGNLSIVARCIYPTLSTYYRKYLIIHSLFKIYYPNGFHS